MRIQNRIPVLIAAIVIFAGAAVLPGAARADSTSDQLAALVAQIQALQARIAAYAQTNVSSAANATTTPQATGSASSTPSVPSGCPNFTRTLSVGMTGDDVAALQSFLSSQHVFSGNATGYFGAVTQAAVLAWQERQGIVDGPDSPGAGTVGKMTRAAMAGVCSMSSQLSGTSTTTMDYMPSSCPVAPPPAQSCDTGWQAVVDSWGCTKVYKCLIASKTPVATTTASTTTSGQMCPVIPQPACANGAAPTSIGTSAKGCVLGYVCQTVQ